MFKNPFAGFDLSSPFTKRSRNLFGAHTTPREFKHGARDIPFGMGAQSLYVDGTDGHDSNDGESWITATKTIQEAVDTADSWTQIFVKDGAYTEAVLIPSSLPNIRLIGESANGTILSSPSVSSALKIEADNFHISNFHCRSGAGATLYSIYANSVDNFSLSNVKSSGVGSDPLNLYLYESTNASVEFFKPIGTFGIVMSGCDQTIPRPAITNCTFDACTLNISNLNSKYNIITGCTFINAGATNGAVKFFASTPADKPTKNLVTHCNFIDCTKTIKVVGAATDNFVVENYYSSHSNVDNGFGIAKAPFVDDLTDPRPVILPSGWLGLSWADADLVALASVCTEARLAELAAANLPTDVDAIKSRTVSMMEFWSDNAISTTLSTTTADVALPNVVVAGIPSGAAIIRVIGMIHPREFVNTDGSPNAINGAAVINVKKSTGAWGTDDVALINIPDNSWNVLADTKRVARMFIGDNNASSEVDGNATYNLRFDGNAFVDAFAFGIVDAAVGLRVYFTP